MKAQDTRARHPVLELLSGCWRSDVRPAPPELVLTEEDARFIVATGAGSLAWPRLAGTALEESAAAQRIRTAFSETAAGNVLVRERLREILDLLRQRGIEAVVLKGLTHGPYYAPGRVRPAGDIDLCVRSRDFAPARETLRSRPDLDPCVDLHRGLVSNETIALDRMDEERAFARARVIDLPSLTVRALPPEDHLRMICIHMIRHGCSSPKWLCDVAAFVEFPHVGFDWAACLAGAGARAGWIEAALRMAAHHLGADLSRTPFGASAVPSPDWILADPIPSWRHQILPHLTLGRLLRHPWASLAAKVPSPLEMVHHTDGPLDAIPVKRRIAWVTVQRAALLLGRSVGLIARRRTAP